MTPNNEQFFANASFLLHNTDVNNTPRVLTPSPGEGNEGYETVATLLLQPPIIVAGLLGNAMCLCVFVGTHLRRQSISVYLAYLSLVDSIFLLTLVAMLLPWVGVGLVNSNGWCQLSIFLSYLCSFLSSWTVTCFTIQRILVVYYPLHKKDWCTRRRAFTLLALCTVVGVATHAFTLHCVPLQEYERAWFVMAWLDTAVTFILPFTFIGVLNTCTATKLWLVAFKALRQENLADNGDINAFVTAGDDNSKRSASIGAPDSCKESDLSRLCCFDDRLQRWPPVAEALLDKSGGPSGAFSCRGRGEG